MQTKILVFAAIALGISTGCAGDVEDDSMAESSELASVTLSLRSGAGAWGTCMDVAGGSTANRTRIQSYACNGSGAQKFKVELSGSDVIIKNTASNKCVDIDNNRSGNGTAVQLFYCNGSAAQTFRLGRNGTLFSFTHISSGKCLDVAGGNPASGTRIQLFDCNSSRSQLFLPGL